MALKFKYNPEKLRIESNDPGIYVRVFGPRREGPFEAALNFESKKIGIHLSSEWSYEGSEDGRLSEWIIDDIFTSIFRHNDEGKFEQYCYPAKFNNLEEQENIIKIIDNAFSVYDASQEPPQINPRVSISSSLQRRLDKGELIK